MMIELAKPAMTTQDKPNPIHGKTASIVSESFSQNSEGSLRKPSQDEP
jgi:hypothetical protein